MTRTLKLQCARNKLVVILGIDKTPDVF